MLSFFLSFSLTTSTPNNCCPFPVLGHHPLLVLTIPNTADITFKISCIRFKDSQLSLPETLYERILTPTSQALTYSTGHGLVTKSVLTIDQVRNMVEHEGKLPLGNGKFYRTLHA